MDNKFLIKAILIFVLLVLGLLVLFVTPNLLPSVLLGLVSYYFLSPLIHYIQKAGLSWVRSAQIVYFVIGFSILAGGFLLFPVLLDESKELIQMLPEISKTAQFTIKAEVRNLENQLGLSLPSDWISYVQPYLLQSASYMGARVPNWITQSLVLFFLAPLFTYFFLTEAGRWPRYFIEVMPKSWWVNVDALLSDLNKNIGGFIRARLLESLIVAVLTWTCLSLIGLPFSFLLGFLAGVLNIIPYIGPVVASVPAIILALSTDSPQSSFMLTVFTYIVIQALDAFVIVPFFVARIVNLHSLFVITAILLGGYLMGVVGMIISIPIAGIVKVSLAHIFSWLEENQ